MAYLWVMNAPRQFGVELLEDRPTPNPRIKTNLTPAQWRRLNSAQRRAYELERRRNVEAARRAGPTPEQARQAAVNLAGIEYMAAALGFKRPGLAKARPRPKPLGPSDEQIRDELNALKAHKTEAHRSLSDDEQHEWTEPDSKPRDRS